MIESSVIYRKFDKIQVKMFEIIYFYDEFQEIGDEKEKKRASSLIEKAKENPQRVNIITKSAANSFYDIDGIFYGLFKKKPNDKFISLSDARILEITKKMDKWVKKKISLPYRFIGIGSAFIESAMMR